MTECEFNDVDAEAAVIFVAYQTLLSQETVDFEDSVRRHVPVEGHYIAVGNPWGPSDSQKVIREAGFVFMPSKCYFSCDKCSVAEWVRRVQHTHGIPPNVPTDMIRGLREWDKIKKAHTDFLEVLGRQEAELLVCKGDPSGLVEQLSDTIDAVRSFRNNFAVPCSTKTIVFLTTREYLNMTRVSIRWLLNEARDFESIPYTVQAIEDIIPASVPLVDLAAEVSEKRSERCSLHSDRRNQADRLYRCCRAEARLLHRVARKLSSYFSA